MKPRVVVCLLLKDGVLFRTKNFRPDYRYTQSFVGTLEADEVVMVDVGTDRRAFYRAAERYAKRCFSPLTLGGHVDSVEEAERLLELGADKVLVRSHRAYLHGVISERWGRQVLVVGFDTRLRPPHAPEGLPVRPIDQIIEDRVRGCIRVAAQGAGEILLTSVERDGSLEGYDLPTLQAVCSAVNVPVLVAGGCGSWTHMLDAFRAGAAGAVTSNIFHFPDPVLRHFKHELSRSGVDVRR